MSEELQQILGVEIFRVGTWNGDVYTNADLDEMVRAAREVPFRVPLKLGHSKDPTAPAVGWLANLRRVGTSLVADFVDMAQSAYDAVKRRAYDNVSAEIYWDTERDGRKYRRLLKAVALLGADIPAVDLKPIHKVVHAFTGEARVYVTTLEFASGVPHPPHPRAAGFADMDAAALGDYVDDRVQDLLDKVPHLPYNRALERVLANDEHLRHAYGASRTVHRPRGAQEE